jgi:hypothetical protein
MKSSISRLLFFPAVALLAAVAYLPAHAQTLNANQTFGFGEGKLLTFTYLENFDCVDQPTDDLNFNGILAQSDPGELQIPICQAGLQPTVNPPGTKGNPYATTEPLYVLIPMFSVNDDQNPNDAIGCTGVVQGTICGTTLGSTLISLFGAVPEAFKTTPLVYAQCPDPGGAAGTCTMHTQRIDLAPVLYALGLTGPPTANIFLPTPNHSHLVIAQDINIKPIWWQVIPVLVLSQSDWPNQAGTSGITSFNALQAAETAGAAIQVPSNFFLFFSSYVTGGDHAHMHSH